MSLKFFHTRSLVKNDYNKRRECVGLRQGWNSQTFEASKRTYAGEWKDDRQTGYGRLITKSHRLYEGLFQDNYRMEYGVSCRAVNAGKNVYELDFRGEWKRGHHHGQGEKHYSDKSYFSGMFRNSNRHGMGCMWYADGSFYYGRWKKDMRHGNGIFIELNGNRYEGNFVRDEKHGLGRFYFLDTGQYLDGIWKNDVCVCGHIADIPYRQTAKNPTAYDIKICQSVKRDLFAFAASKSFFRSSIRYSVF